MSYEEACEKWRTMRPGQSLEEAIFAFGFLMTPLARAAIFLDHEREFLEQYCAACRKELFSDRARP